MQKRKKLKTKKQRLAKIMHLAEEISYNENIDMETARQIAEDRLKG